MREARLRFPSHPATVAASLALLIVGLPVWLADARALGAAAPPVAAATDAPRDLPGLHNVVDFRGQGADGFYSGSVPEGDAGFDALVGLGVKTVISVDGALPDLARAKARGLRYVHLPIGYDGFDDARKAELVRAVRDLPRPIYLHCHHGKHRSAGAAATIAVSLGWMTNAQAAFAVQDQSPVYPSAVPETFMRAAACALVIQPSDTAMVAAAPALRCFPWWQCR